MKKATVLAWALVAAGVVRADLVGTYQTATLDGSLVEWDAGDVLYTDDEIGDGDPVNSSYENIYVANDNTLLYLGLDTKGTGGGDIVNSYTRNLFIDADLDSNTGFDAGWMTGGYDRLVQYGAGGGVYSVYSFSGGDQGTWNWNFINTISYSYNDDVIELAISLADLGLSGGDSARLEFNVTGAGVNAETWARSSEASVETYTIAVVPEPGTALLLAGGLVVAGLARRRVRTA